MTPFGSPLSFLKEKFKTKDNKALHLTAFPLRFKAAGELGGSHKSHGINHDIKFGMETI